MNLRTDIRKSGISKSVKQFVKDTVLDALVPPTPFEIGKTYLIRTVTMIDVGRVTKIIGNFLVLEDASWIADTGRFNECLTKADSFQEIEPFKHPVYVAIDSIIDATPWPYTLPTAPK